MAQRSRFWDGTTIGDATVAPYDAGTEFAQVMVGVAGMVSDPNKGGLLSSISVTVFSPGTVRVGAFEALVYGTWYQNDANVDFTIPTPATATRIDTLVLRKSWAAQTVRLLVMSGTEGGAAPALVQTIGTTWDVPIATISTTTAGANTITQTNSRADLWYRTSDTTIRTDSNAAIGANFPTGMGPAVRGLELGTDGIIWGSSSGLGGTLWGCNLIHDGTNFKAVQTGGGSQIVLTPTTFGVALAASVSAGAVQTYTTGLFMNANRTVTITPVANIQALVLTNNNTTESTASLQISRAAPATQYHWLSFQGGASVGDFYIGRRPNSDFLKIAFWNGVSLADRVSIDPFGSVTFTPASGAAIFTNTAGISLQSVSGANLNFESGGNQVIPNRDNGLNFGLPSNRWIALYAVNGAIQTSHVSMKQDFAALDPIACTQAILDTDWVSFKYIDPSPPERDAYTTDEQWAQQQELYRENIERTVISRQQKGYVLGSDQYKVSDLFGTADRYSASTHADLAVVACALQQALREIADLKSRLPN